MVISNNEPGRSHFPEIMRLTRFMGGVTKFPMRTVYRITVAGLIRCPIAQKTAVAIAATLRYRACCRKMLASDEKFNIALRCCESVRHGQ